MKTIRLGQEFEPFAHGAIAAKLDNKFVGVTSGRFWLEWYGVCLLAGSLAHLEGYTETAKSLILDKKGEGQLINADLVPPAIKNQGYLLKAVIEYNPKKPITEREANLLCIVTIGSLGLLAENEEKPDPKSAGAAYFYNWSRGGYREATEIIAINEAVFRNMKARFMRIDSK